MILHFSLIKKQLLLVEDFGSSQICEYYVQTPIITLSSRNRFPSR